MPPPEVTGRKPRATSNVTSHPPSTGPPPRQTAAQTISEFCADNRISRAQYYRLKKKGLGPDETRFGDDGKIVLITAESGHAWRRRHTKKATA
jgi:hypothetical protein